MCRIVLYDALSKKSEKYDFMVAVWWNNYDMHSWTLNKEKYGMVDNVNIDYWNKGKFFGMNKYVMSWEKKK